MRSAEVWMAKYGWQGELVPTADIELWEPQIVRPQAYRYGLEPATSLGTVSTAPSDNLDGNAGKRVGEAALSIQQSALSNQHSAVPRGTG